MIQYAPGYAPEDSIPHWQEHYEDTNAFKKGADMAKFIDLTGKKFGRLTVIGRAKNMSGRTAWRCVCECLDEECLNEITVIGSNLQSGNTTSCGCVHREQAAKNIQSKAKAQDQELIEKCVETYKKVQEKNSNIIKIEAYIAAKRAMAQRGTR